ncbi:MAG: NAD(P)-dependent oxidoreductase [Dysgonamonadaceae bacterium]|jgi:nucleoside-diphosphate-sugar epimerase|nr:NAD(P)-dependent oxidoreductase [Dysgonamonadaceae bacterium]
MKILITGASGFIGSFLVEEALRRTWKVWAGVRRSSSREYLQNPQISFIDLNYSDKETLERQISEHVSRYGKWDYVVHNAGLTKSLDIRDFEKVNYLFTRRLIEALQETDAVPAKFVLMSSLSAYPNPESAYGKSKLKAERFLESQTDFPYIILRPTGVYGPRDKDYLLMLKTIDVGWDVTAGFKPQQLTFIYVKDLVKAVFLALENPLSHKAYSVSDGHVYTDASYTQIVKTALGKKFTIQIRVPLFVLKIVSVLSESIAHLTKKPATLNRDKYKIMKQRDWTCDNLPLQQDLDFKADYDLERGIAECVKWYGDLKVQNK